MHPSISINTLSLAPASLPKRADSVARLGATAIGPTLHEIEECGAMKAARAIRDAGLKVSNLTHLAFGYATPEEMAAEQERLRRTIGVAADLNAGSILMTTGGRGALTWGEAAERFAHAMVPCAELAREARVRLAIEPISHLFADISIAHRLSDTTALARMAGISVIADLFACWVDSDLEWAIADAGDLLALVQVSDYVHGDRGLPCRAVPGDGEIPLERLIGQIAASGYAGYYDLELIGPRIESEGHVPGLLRAAAHVERILEGLEA